jgi:hypothetical protein
MDTATYQLHQTPPECAKDLMAFVPLVEGDIVAEPFRGEGAFYDNFPDFVVKKWAELEKGIDYTTLEEYDWIVTNPPFSLQNGNKLVSSFWYLLDYYSTRARKGIAFLGNDYCFSTLTPKRQALLKERGWAITKVVVCNIKKWRGRYFFFILQKQDKGMMDYLLKSY